MLLKNKVKIKEWLNKYNIRNYVLKHDEKYGYVVNVNCGVDLSNINLNLIEVKFNIVDGWFDCRWNNLKSLEGSPKIVNGNFYGNFNQLESLKGCPKKIKGNFYCDSNHLTIKEICNNLPNEVESNYIGLDENDKLGELQYITDFNKFKKIMNIYKEKIDFMEVVESTEIVKVIEKRMNKI